MIRSRDFERKKRICIKSVKFLSEGGWGKSASLHALRGVLVGALHTCL